MKWRPALSTPLTLCEVGRANVHVLVLAEQPGYFAVYLIVPWFLPDFNEDFKQVLVDTAGSGDFEPINVNDVKTRIGDTSIAFPATGTILKANIAYKESCDDPRASLNRQLDEYLSAMGMKLIIRFIGSTPQ